MARDYYETLGVPRDASQDDIRHAFKRLAGVHHPDKGGGEAAFKELNQAYQVLSDETKKSLYDRFGTEDVTKIPPQPPPRARRPGRINLEDDFADVFRQSFNTDPFGTSPFGPFGGGFSDFARKAQRATAPGADVNVKVTVPMDEALSGTKKEIRYERGETRPCTKCARTRHNITVCPTCGGNGRVIDMINHKASVRQCGACRGNGSVPLEQCGTCRGTGVENVQHVLTIKIPKGLRTGQGMRVKGHGKPGNPPGDMHVTVEIVDSPSWWARGEELFTVVEVPLASMLKGGPVPLSVPDGRTLTVEMPSGGGFARLPKVWQNPGEGGDGDLTVLFRAQKPGGSISARGERLLQELLDEVGRARPR